MASFDKDGLKIDRLADIYRDISTSLKSSFGDSVDLDERSPLGIIVGIMSERYSLLYELLEGVYNASFPSTAYGIYLDYVCALNGISRNPAVASTVDLTFTRSNDASSGQVEIPAGTQVKSDLNDTLVWSTDSGNFIASGNTTATVRATCSETGTIAAAANTLTFMPSTPNNIASVTNIQEATLGNDEETDAELRARRETSLGKSSTPTQLGLTSALLNMLEVQSASVTVNDTDEVLGTGQTPHSFQAYISPETGQNLGQVGTLQFSRLFATGDEVTVSLDGTDIWTQAFTADSPTTLNLIANAIKDQPSIASTTILGDTAIQVQGATATAFTLSTTDNNSSGITSDFSVTTSDSGLIDKVAQTLWDSKAAGIQTYGDLTGIATDTNGNTHEVYFSTITSKQVFVEYTLTVTSLDLYETGNNQTLIDALSSYAVINYTAGVDVLQYELITVAGNLDIEYVTSIDVKVSTDDTNYYVGNVVISPEEFAFIPSSSISVVVQD